MAPQVFRFLLAGIANTAVDWGLFALLSAPSGLLLLHPVAAKTISYLAGAANSYLLNRRWTFHSRTPIQRTFPLFLAGSLAGTLINVACMHLLTNWGGLSRPPALLLATGAAFIWNFLFSKFYVFNPHRATAQAEQSHLKPAFSKSLPGA